MIVFNNTQPMGCICPPTSEQTCQNPQCPRKNRQKDEEQWVSKPKLLNEEK